MKNKHSGFSGSLGFVLAAAGSAVGVGNIWRFPYLCAKDGGGLFLLVYLVLVLTFGFTLLTTDVAISRRTKQNALNAFGTLHKKWRFLGYLTFLVPTLIMTYYSTVGGWCLTYLFEAIMGNAASSDLAMLEKTFLKTVSTPVSAILYQTLFLAITAGVLIFGVNKGIERISKVLMPLLFVLMIVLIIRGLTLPGAWEGLKFLFSPKWDQVTANSLLNAMGFTFFSLSVGMGIMVTYGSYISHKENLTTTALWVRGDDLNLFVHQIVPVSDLFRIAFPDEENYRRSIRGTVIGKFLFPAFFNQSGLLDQCDIMLKCQCHDIGVTSLHDGTRLCTGTSVGLNNIHFFSRFFLIIFLKQRIICFIKFSCRIVGDVGDCPYMTLFVSASGTSNQQNCCHGQYRYFLYH